MTPQAPTASRSRSSAGDPRLPDDPPPPSPFRSRRGHCGASRRTVPTSPRPSSGLTGLGRVAIDGIGRDVHLLHTRVLPARQGPHGRRGPLRTSPPPPAPRPVRGSAASRGWLGCGAAAVTAERPRRAAHHPSPGTAAAPLPGGGGCRPGPGGAVASGRVMSVATRAGSAAISANDAVGWERPPFSSQSAKGRGGPAARA